MVDNTFSQKNIELEDCITKFLAACREAKGRYEYCQEAERLSDNKTQDILHVIELDPESFSDLDLLSMLHEVRQERREVKESVQVAQSFNKWFNENKKAIDSLTNTLGDIRKVLKYQTTPHYFWKTNLIGEVGKMLEPRETGLIQLTLF